VPQPAAHKTESGEYRGAVKGSQLAENAVSSIKWMRQGAGALLAQLFILRAGEPRSDGDTEHWVPTGTQVGLKGWMFRGNIQPSSFLTSGCTVVGFATRLPHLSAHGGACSEGAN